MSEIVVGFGYKEFSEVKAFRRALKEMGITTKEFAYSGKTYKQHQYGLYHFIAKSAAASMAFATIGMGKLSYTSNYNPRLAIGA